MIKTILYIILFYLVLNVVGKIFSFYNLPLKYVLNYIVFIIVMFVFYIILPSKIGLL